MVPGCPQQKAAHALDLWMRITAPDLRRELDHRDSFREFLDEKLWSCRTVSVPPRVDRIDLSLGLRRYDYGQAHLFLMVSITSAAVRP
jgi:hypothetical protein